MSPRGFGLAPRADLQVFQPFFLELSLPYSIIRGERFELKATVFNYLTKCLMVRLVPPWGEEQLLPVLLPVTWWDAGRRAFILRVFAADCDCSRIGPLPAGAALW